MSKLAAERLVAVCLIIVAAILYTQSTGLPQRAGSFPQFAEISVALLAALIFARTFLESNKKNLEGNVYFEFFIFLNDLCIGGFKIRYPFFISFYLSAKIISA